MALGSHAEGARYMYDNGEIRVMVMIIRVSLRDIAKRPIAITGRCRSAVLVTPT